MSAVKLALGSSDNERAPPEEGPDAEVLAAIEAQAVPGRGPSPEVLAALDAQTTPEMIARAIKFAQWQRHNLLVRRVEYVEPASDQVAAVLVQLREGTLSWDPARCSLLVFVCGVVETRCRRLLRRARERSYDAMIDGRSGEGSDRAAEFAATVIEEALALHRGPATTPDVALDRARVFDRFVTAMSRLVALREDPDLTRAFQAWIDSAAVSELDVARVTGLPASRARRAVRILRALLDELPAALCSQIKEVLS